MNRRELFKWLGVGGLMPAAVLAAPRSVSYRVVDLRLGLPAGSDDIMVGPDVSAAWYGRIAPLMSRLDKQGEFLGLTRGDALFPLQSLAADAGWRLVQCEPLEAWHRHDVPTQGWLPEQAYAWVLRPRRDI